MKMSTQTAAHEKRSSGAEERGSREGTRRAPYRSEEARGRGCARRESVLVFFGSLFFLFFLPFVFLLALCLTFFCFRLLFLLPAIREEEKEGHCQDNYDEGNGHDAIGSSTFWFGWTGVDTLTVNESEAVRPAPSYMVKVTAPVPSVMNV